MCLSVGLGSVCLNSSFVCLVAYNQVIVAFSVCQIHFWRTGNFSILYACRLEYYHIRNRVDSIKIGVE